MQLCITELAQAPSRFNSKLLLPIDIISQVVTISIIVLILFIEIRLVFRPNGATIDEVGVMLPSPTKRRASIQVAWGDIRALYLARTRDAYWLVVTDDAIYGWLQSPFSRGLGGTHLAQAISERLHMPVRNANDLCLTAVGEVPAVPERVQRWAELLAQAPQPPHRHGLRGDIIVSFVLVAFGLSLGIAASWVISQFA